MNITHDGSLEFIAKNYAIRCHDGTNHYYDNKPYETHLQMVVDNAYSIKDLVPYKSDFETIVAACWCHDVIEDCRQTYNDVKKMTSQKVADIVYAVTDEKGKNRSERESDKFFHELVQNPLAVIVKLCDRLANIEYSRKSGSSMYKKYQKELPNFIEKIWAYNNFDTPDEFASFAPQRELLNKIKTHVSH